VLKIVAIGVGGSIGAILRYLISVQIGNWLGRDFPYGTLIVNIVGCLILGIVYTLFHSKIQISDELLHAIQLGLLGAFTTYSTFSLETLQMLQKSEFLKAGIYIALSVVLSLLAVWVGTLIAKFATS